MRKEALIKLILSLPEAQQSAHESAPDFRVGSRIFATLSAPETLVLNLTPEQQGMVLKSDPEIYAPVEGSWGKRGWTNAKVDALDEATALAALIMAYGNATGKQAAAS